MTEVMVWMYRNSDDDMGFYEIGTPTGRTPASKIQWECWRLPPTPAR